jgi:hypothetical protein
VIDARSPYRVIERAESITRSPLMWVRDLVDHVHDKAIMAGYDAGPQKPASITSERANSALKRWGKLARAAAKSRTPRARGRHREGAV